MKTSLLSKNTVIMLLVMLLVFAVSVFFRAEQYQAWKKLPHENTDTAYLSVMTDDGHFWSRIAKEYKDGLPDEPGIDHKRFYPDGEGSLRPVPLLSVMLAETASAFDVSVEKAGIYISPYLASFFIIPLFLYFMYLGVPAAGVLGGVVGTFSFYYYIRTSFGYVDTDLLNLFFMYMTSLFILLASEETDKRKVIIFSALAGFTQFVFYRWYFKPGFILIYLAVYLVCMFLSNRGDRKLLLYGSLAYVLCTNPLYFAESFTGVKYFLVKFILGGSSSESLFPNALQFVAEFQKVSAEVVLGSVFSSVILTASGLIIFVVMQFYYWRRMLPLAPILLLGVFSFFSSVRFTYYLAAFSGIGYGLLIHYLSDRFLKERTKGFYQYIPVGLSVLAALVLINFTAYDKMRLPSGAPDEVIDSYKSIHSRLPESAPIYTWWDDGYKITNITGNPTYHDGGIQSTAKTYFIAKSLI